jgi:tetratricopeptide (TPR) repeat protein
VARDDFNRSADLSADPSLMVAAAQGLGAMAFYSDALSILDRGIKRFPSFWELHKYRADVEISLGNDPEAIREFQVAAQLASGTKLAAVLGDRGDFFRLRQDYRLAIADYSRAIALDPTYYVLFAGRAAAYLAGGSLQNATKDYTTAINLYTSLHSASTWPLVHLYEDRGKAFLQFGDRSRASQDLHQALDILTPAGPSDWRNRLTAELILSGG